MKDYFLDYVNGKIELDEIPETLTPTEKEHGKCIGIRQNEPYHDVYIYEDGYEEWESIGD
jgi:hypothetical protein